MAFLSKAFVIASFMILVNSCKTTNSSNSESVEKSSTEAKSVEKVMMSQGFQEAQLQVNTSEGCPVFLIVGDEQLDPINIQDFSMKVPSKVWVKFGRLRMKNRCDEANPVKVEAIEKR